MNHFIMTYFSDLGDDLHIELFKARNYDSAIQVAETLCSYLCDVYTLDEYILEEGHILNKSMKRKL